MGEGWHLDFAMRHWQKWRIWINKVKSWKEADQRSRGKRMDSIYETEERWAPTHLGFWWCPNACRLWVFSALTVSQFSFCKIMLAWLCWFTGLFRLFMERAWWDHLIFVLIFPSPSLSHLIKAFLSLTCSATTMVLSRSAMLQVIKPRYPETSGMWMHKISAPVQEMKKDKLKKGGCTFPLTLMWLHPCLWCLNSLCSCVTSELPTWGTVPGHSVQTSSQT